MKKNYIENIRKKVGHNPIILTYAGGILLNEENEILLQKRADFNKWGLPGGAIEYGETCDKTCKREFLEETGLKVSIQSLLGISSNQIQNYPNGDKAQSIVIEFVVEKESGHLSEKSDETLDLKYFSFHNLPTIINEQHATAINNFFTKNYPYFN